MTTASLKKNFRQQGLCGGIIHYVCRLCFKLQVHIIGKWAQIHCRVRENRIVFKNAQFQDYRDNTRAFSDYLIRNGINRQFEIIWMVSDRKRFRDVRIPNVKFITAENHFGWSSPAACWYGATAKYFFYTHNSAGLNRYRCSGQVVVNLWHGCGYKSFVPDAERPEFNYALVPGPLFVKTKAEYWGCSREQILQLGYPRYDWMLQPSKNRDALLHGLLQDVPGSDRVVIWLPTFRKGDDSRLGVVNLPYDLPGLKDDEELSQIDTVCSENRILLLIKKHPLQLCWRNKKDSRYIRYITDDMLDEADLPLYALLGCCDALITDYSSAAVDFLLLDRPIGFVLSDFAEYSTGRGFAFDEPLDYMPGEKLYNVTDIECFLKHVSLGDDPFCGDRRRLIPLMHNPAGLYCKRLADVLNLRKED